MEAWLPIIIQLVAGAIVTALVGLLRGGGAAK